VRTGVSQQACYPNGIRLMDAKKYLTNL
jgi:hypothetical protein